jgi:hypothetical protein
MYKLNNGFIMVLISLVTCGAWADLESTVSRVVVQKSKLDIQLKKPTAQKQSTSKSSVAASPASKSTAVVKHTDAIKSQVSARLALPKISKPIALK